MNILYRVAAGVLKNCDPNALTDKCDTNLPQITADKAALQNMLQILFGVIAAMAVIFIIISAIRYQTSLGNPEATAKIRNTIIYVGVGLAVALSAELIVTFALGRI